MLDSMMKLTFSSLTSYFSGPYIVLFLMPVLILFQICPKKCRKYFLLLASYGLFFLISSILVLYLIAITILMFVLGQVLENKKKECKEKCKSLERAEKKVVKQQYAKKQHTIIVIAVLIIIGGLGIFKYSGFVATNINALLGVAHVSTVLPVPHLIMPIGISFFTLQGLSYLFDVNRGTLTAEKNIFKLALFMAFFPQIIEGPICRYEQTADKLWNIQRITWDNLVLGGQRFIYGMMKKMVIADRLDPLVAAIFDNYTDYSGGIIAFGAACYTLQLYMDFSGCMDAVMGMAQILGIELPENFKRPFFSRTISEFWTRWHITLGAWLRDYIFYPVSLSGAMKKLMQKSREKLGPTYGALCVSSVALFAVWICNGIWHGSDWNFIFFGLYHFVLILIGSLIAPTVLKVNEKYHINSNSTWYKFLQILRTIILVIIGEMFFRAEGIKNGLGMFARMVTNFSGQTLNSDLLDGMGVDVKDIGIVIVTTIIVFIISIICEKGIDPREWIAKQNVVVRWAIMYALIIFIVIFGAYGLGYAPVDPMYANF